MDVLDYRNLDAIFHSRIRLAVVSAITKGGILDFNELMSITGATAGNLATHLRKLEDAGYVLVEKGFQGRRTRTTYALSDKGRAAFESYIGTLASFLDGGNKEETDEG